MKAEIKGIIGKQKPVGEKTYLTVIDVETGQSYNIGSKSGFEVSAVEVVLITLGGCSFKPGKFGLFVTADDISVVKLNKRGGEN